MQIPATGYIEIAPELQREQAPKTVGRILGSRAVTSEKLFQRRH